MSDRSSTTLGYERSTNPYFDPNLTREAFVERILGGVPPFPPYYRRMKRINSEGPRTLGGLPGDLDLPLAEFRALVDDGAVVVDLRDQLAFGGGHIPGSFGIGARGKVAQWASWVVPYDTPIVLVTESPTDRARAIRSLIRVGLDDVRGALAGGIAAWRESGAPIARFRERSVREVADLAGTGALTLIDVRSRKEWDAGHPPKAEWIYLGDLASRLRDERPARDRGREVALLCRTGYRSTVAASVVARLGFEDVTNVTGGIRAWKAAGLPTAN